MIILKHTTDEQRAAFPLEEPWTEPQAWRLLLRSTFDETEAEIPAAFDLSAFGRYALAELSLPEGMASGSYEWEILAAAGTHVAGGCATVGDYVPQPVDAYDRSVSYEQTL